MSIRACILLNTYTLDSQLPFPLIRLFDGGYHLIKMGGSWRFYEFGQFERGSIPIF